MGVYSKLKVFNYPDKLASLQGDVLPPLHVRLKPTNVCNHHCSYCAYKSPDLKLGETMNTRDSIPPEKMGEIIDDLGNMGIGAVTFSGGGEPFGYPSFIIALSMLVFRGIHFAALTNGSYLSGDRAEFFALHGSWLRVSIDGWDGPSYARYRGVKESEFDRILDNMAAFTAMQGKCKLSACINVDHDNAGHVYELIKTLAGRAGVKTIKVTPVIVGNSSQANYDYHKPHVKLVAHQIRVARRDLPQIEIHNDYRAGLETFNKEYTWCPMLQVRPVIGADSNVYACQDTAYTEVGRLFSIKEQSFCEGWLRGDWRYKINPSRDCTRHCANDAQNKIILEYLDVADKEFT